MKPAPLKISGSDPARAVVFDPPHLLAPMEGVTDPLFRDFVISLGGVGGASTEFLRISSSALPARLVRRHLGALRRDCVVGVQLMAADEAFVAETVASAERAGAAYVDLNFGCPAPVVFNKCAGSALLAKPEAIARIVARARAATGLPVTAKMRAGIDGAGRMLEVIHAVAEAGAAMISLHARLRCHSYAEPATWAWIAEAKAFMRARGIAIPLVGNGGVDVADDVARMRDETGCDGVMIGRGAIRDPWIFAQALGAAAPTRAVAAGFAIRYGEAIRERRDGRVALVKLKQLTRWFRAGGVMASEEEAKGLLRVQRYEELRGFYERAVGAAEIGYVDAARKA